MYIGTTTPRKGMTKERFYDVVLTALIGAGIAFLQSLLVGMTTHQLPTASPEVAAAAAGAWKLMSTRIYYS